MTLARTTVAMSLALLSLGALAACDDVNEVDPRPSFAALDAEGSDLVEETADYFIAAPSALPVSGSAAYDGVVALETDGAGGAPTEMIGELDLAVSFADDSVSGRATNFVTSEEAELDGTLTVDGGFDRLSDPETETSIDAVMAGTLRDGDERFAVAANMTGDFLSQDGEPLAVPDAVVGGVTGTVGTAEVTDGGFIAD